MKKALFVSCIGFLFTACSYFTDTPSGTLQPFSVENTFSFDGIKLIAKDIEDGADPNTYGRKVYIVNTDRRLLMRFESLSAHEKEVDASKPVKLVIAVMGDDRASQIGYLSVCPIDRDWMMLATWKNAHPFGIEGKWSDDGGDYQYPGCRSGTILQDYPEAKTVTVEFDMSRWFLDYPRGKQINYGLILISHGSETLIQGEKNYYPPKISFSEWHRR